VRLFLCILGLFSGGLLLAGPPALLTGCRQGDSVERGCQTSEDCPRPDRQICEVQTGVCVGFTSLPGKVDGGDGEEADGGQNPDGQAP
jgi:hypothetical protein